LKNGRKHKNNHFAETFIHSEVSLLQIYEIQKWPFRALVITEQFDDGMQIL